MPFDQSFPMKKVRVTNTNVKCAPWMKYGLLTSSRM